jgi:3',5'-cyclic AMP phosphodiesterase CpdA
MLKETGRRKLFRVLLIHHPPVAGMVSRRKALTDAEAFGAVIKHCGAELILHGHSHRRSRAEMEGPAAPIPILGVSSATATSERTSRRAAFRRIRIELSAHGWETRVHDHLLSEQRA